MPNTAKPRSLEDLWEHLQNIAVREGDCWLIEGGSKASIGYRQFNVGGRNGRNIYVHHVADEIWNGSRPKGIVVMHICDRPNCCNPDHLRRGTPAENIADKVSKGRHSHGSKHYRSKLTEEQVAEIRASTGKTYAELSRIYGISRGGIYNIKNGTSRKETRFKENLFLVDTERFEDA